MGSKTLSDAPPSEERINILIDTLIQQQSAMTLATAHGNLAWAAPVYYVYHSHCFYFFSSPSSRHVQECIETGHAAAAIHAHGTTWKEIRGIQMFGFIHTVPVGVNALGVIRAYLKKFSFAKEFFKPGDLFHLDDFAKRFHVKLYGFRPTILCYADNQIHFGFKEMRVLSKTQCAAAVP